MTSRYIKLMIIIVLSGFLIYTFYSEGQEISKIKGNETQILVTKFDENTQLYSDDFINQFKINSYMNEGWLGILIKKNDIYELHHFTILNGEEYIDYDFDMSNVTELYICDGNIDYFVGEIIGANSKTYLKQFQMYVDTSFFEGKEITGSYFKGFIDVYEIDLNSVTDEIVYKSYAGSVDENTLIETWHFNLKNE